MRTMWNRLTSGLALSLTLAALCGCSDAEPNGKNGVLYFNTPPHPMARHLENELLLPEHVTIYSGNIELPATFSYDFSGTTLDVQVAEGLEVLGTSFEPSRDGSTQVWRIRIRCQTPHGERTELAVRVMDGKRVRYEDAYDISCWEPETLSVSLPNVFGQSDKTPTTVLQGGRFLANVRVMGMTTGGYQEQLSGTGVAVGEPQGPVSIIEPSRTLPDGFVFRAERLGKQPLLKAGPLTAPMPLEVVPNEGWSLRTWTSYTTSSGRGLLLFTGYAELSDGRLAAGLHEACTATHTPQGGELSLEPYSECTGRVMNASATGELCIEAFGRKGCSTY